jgi:hypothetical protein
MGPRAVSTPTSFSSNATTSDYFFSPWTLPNA